MDIALAVEQKFGKDNYRKAVTDLLELRQTGSVEAYYTAFQALQFQVCMYNSEYGEVFFTSQFVNGLKEEIRYSIQGQVPDDVDRAYFLAKIQQRIVERTKCKMQKCATSSRSGQCSSKGENKQQGGNTLWRERQLRDYRKANGLCYYCGEKFEPGHVEVCSKRTKAQLNTLAVNDLDQNLTDEVLNQLAVEDSITEDFLHLSLHAIAGTEGAGSFKIKSLVKNKTMLMLLDSGSSHSFVSSSFVAATGLKTVPTTPQTVQLANGQLLVTNQLVPQLEWVCQGHTLTVDMRVLELGTYDAILGFDWLETCSPMQCDWGSRTMEFTDKGRQIKIQGIKPAIMKLDTMSAKLLWKSCKGNDIWAYAIVNFIPEQQLQDIPENIQCLLHQYTDIFSDAKMLPPTRVYDHAIALQPGAVPINCRPYKYSPQHKTEIERQVKELLEAGLITHSTSPFASPVLLVQKKDGSWRFCVDYRRLNAITFKNRFPIPIIEEILDELAGSKYFTKLDMKSRYHQVRMLLEDEYKTAFKTHQGHYQFKVMPFGLTNAPSTFQCIMNEVLRPFLRKFVLVFLDDILIYSPSLQAHEEHVQQVFDVLRNHNFFLKPSKCSFAQHSLFGIVRSHYLKKWSGNRSN